MRRMYTNKDIENIAKTNAPVKDVKVNGVSVVNAQGVATIFSGSHSERFSIYSVVASDFTDTVSTTALGNMYLHRCYFIESGVEYTITIQTTASGAFTSLQTILEWLSSGLNVCVAITADTGSLTKEGFVFKVVQSGQYDFDIYAIVAS